MVRFGLVIAALWVTACAAPWEKTDPETGIPLLELGERKPEQATQIKSADYALTTTSCTQLAADLRRAAIAQLLADTQARFAADWRAQENCGQDPYYPTGYGPDAGVAMADASSAPMPTQSGDPEGHSETNNQVAGVDEADIVKTDGYHIYLISGSSLQIVQAWPAHHTKVVANVALPDQPKKMFVLGDRLLLYSGHGSGTPPKECTYGYNCIPTGDGQPTTLRLYDISDRAQPKLLREIDLSGSLLAARRIGETIYTVVTQPAINPVDQMRLRPPGLDICTTSKRGIYRAYLSQLIENVEQLLKADFSSYLPTAKDSAGHPDPFAQCGELHASPLGDGDQFTSLLALSLKADKPLSATTLFSRPGTVYASKAALYLAVPRQHYVASNQPWYDGYETVEELTVIHKFALDPAAVNSSYVASGAVEGRPLNQFSLDEYDGYLRIALTTGSLGWSSENGVTILQQQQKRLKIVGSLTGLAPTEDIRAVRFDATHGYVVTFKKTDPLYVIDLSSPTAPKLLGELKIPGFSTYMQKIGDGKLLSLGYDGDDQGSFAWFTGVSLQLFDVSDPTNPLLKHKHVIGTRGSSSEALTNHLAFTYYGPKDLLVLPITICEESQGGGNYGEQLTFSGALLLNVDFDKGFSLRGSVEHPLSSSYYGCHNWWTDASSQVKRTLVIDNYVYSLSEQLLKVTDLSAPEQDLVSLGL